MRTAPACPPVCFVHRDPDAWLPLAEDPPDPTALRDAFQQGADCWIAQTWLELVRRGRRDVRLVREPLPGHACVLHADTFIRLRPREDVFWIVVRPDRGPVPLADLCIVQNEAMRGRSAQFVPQWPEPGLRPRDPARGDRFERIAYFGRRLWLAPELQAPEFAAAIAHQGMQFEIREDAWWDYSDVDAVVAIRSCHPALLATKPATKLVNAWIAGAVPLLGPEPAYREIGQAGIDYLEVRDAADIVAALRRLRHDRTLREQLLADGRARAATNDADAVAAAWMHLLDGAVAAEFTRWLARPWLRRAVRRCRQRVLQPVQQLAWDGFDLRVGQLDPRRALYQSPHRGTRLLARCEILRREGSAAVTRAMRNRFGRRSRLPQARTVPAVTVLMAVHDGERHVAAAIDSVLRQTFTDFELIIVDDASRDRTPEILASYRDPRIVLLRNTANLGLTRSLNLGLARARGAFVARLDHDDICEPERLQQQVAWLEARPGTAVAGSWTTEVDADGREIGTFEPNASAGYVAWQLARRNIVYQSTVMMRRDAVRAVGGYDETLRFAQDHDLWTRLLMAGQRVELIPQRLVRYRRSPSQISAVHRDEQDRSGLAVRQRYLEWLLLEAVPIGRIDSMRRLLRLEAAATVPDPRGGFALIDRVYAAAMRRADRGAAQLIRRELRATLLHHAGAVLHMHDDVGWSLRLALHALALGPSGLLHVPLLRHFGAVARHLLRFSGRRELPNLAARRASRP